MSNSRGVGSSASLEAEAGLRGRTAQASDIDGKRAGTVSRVRLGKPKAALQSPKLSGALERGKPGRRMRSENAVYADRLSRAAEERA